MLHKAKTFFHFRDVPHIRIILNPGYVCKQLFIREVRGYRMTFGVISAILLAGTNVNIPSREACGVVIFYKCTKKEF